MAIYDYDGTVNAETGKVYDFDGTAKHLIGKVYAGDGTAVSLIYSAELVFPDALTVPRTTGSTSGSANSSAINISGYNNLKGHLYCVGGVTSGSTSIGSTVTADMYLYFADGTKLLLATAARTFYGGGTDVIYDGNFDVDVSAYPDTQKQETCLCVEWTASNGTVGNGITNFYADNLIAY